MNQLNALVIWTYVPNFENKAEIDAIDDELPSLILNTYTKTEVDNLLMNINLTGSEYIGITNNQIALTYPLTIDNEAFLNPRVNDHVDFFLQRQMVFQYYSIFQMAHNQPPFLIP